MGCICNRAGRPRQSSPDRLAPRTGGTSDVGLLLQPRFTLGQCAWGGPGSAFLYYCRPERRGDEAAIHELNAAAFPTADEAELVDALRAAGRLVVSLVAADADTVVGHIAFSPVTAGDHAGLGRGRVHFQAGQGVPDADQRLHGSRDAQEGRGGISETHRNDAR